MHEQCSYFLEGKFQAIVNKLQLAYKICLCAVLNRPMADTICGHPYIIKMMPSHSQSLWSFVQILSIWISWTNISTKFWVCAW